MIGQKSGGWLAGGLVVAGWGWIAGTSTVDAGESRAKVAMTSSLASAPDEIRQRAFDGHDDTAFGSKEPAKDGDHLTLTFDAPAVIKSIAVETGRAGGGDVLDGGVLEVSEDGTKFEPVATFDLKGSARSEIPDKPLRSIRVRVKRDLGHSLVVREFTIASDRVKPFQHPVEFTVNVQAAPEIGPWTEATARLCEQWYDALVEELPSENFEPISKVTLTMRRDYDGVAAAGGGRITGSVKYFETHRDDQGAFIHETVHIIQNYPGRRRNPGWLVEGVADYVRFFIYEPGKAGRVNPARAKYDASYRTSAAFLDYVSRTHDKDLVKKLNQAMRAGKYDKAIFEQLTGKPVETLNEDWLASLRR